MYCEPAWNHIDIIFKFILHQSALVVALEAMVAASTGAQLLENLSLLALRGIDKHYPSHMGY